MFTPSKKIHFIFFSVVGDDDSSESEGEDREDLEGIFDDVPMDNSDLAMADNIIDDLSFSPLGDTPPPPTPASPPPPAPTQMTVAADVHHSPNLDLDVDETPTGWHMSNKFR